MKRFVLLFFLVACGFCAVPENAEAISTIVLDAGHGGHDRGGVPGQRLSEKIYTLDIAKRVQTRLRNAGFKTVMTRDGDYFVGLGARVAIADAQRNAVFLSMHMNSGSREGACGIETYYYSKQSASFAALVHAHVVRASGTPNRGIRQRGFYVIRHPRIPAVLCELGFLTNRAEGGRIANSAAYRQKLADALADAVIEKYR